MYNRSQTKRQARVSLDRPTTSGKRSLQNAGTFPKRRRTTISSQISTLSSRQSTNSNTPIGTPIPIRPRVDGGNVDTLEAENESLDQVILAFDKDKKAMGCAYYVAGLGSMFCMEDIKSCEDDIIATLKVEVQPTIVLYSPRVQPSAEDIRGSGISQRTVDDDVVLPYKLELRPSSDFKHDRAVQKLADIPALRNATGVRFLVPGEDLQNIQINHVEAGFTDEKGRAHHISGSVNLDSKLSIGCAGAILTYLHRKKTSEFLQDGPAAENAFEVLSLKSFSLKDIMPMNVETLAALQILQPEAHPSAAKQGPATSGSKESLSIYGLFSRFAKTPQGKQHLRSMFLRPSTELETIRDRHDTVAVLVMDENREAAGNLSKSLSKIRNMQRVVKLLHKGIEGGDHSRHISSIRSNIWSSLLDFCFHVIDISETISELTNIQLVPSCRQIQQALLRPDFRRIGKLVWDVVDLEESQEQHRTVVKRGIDEDLDNVKDAYDTMEEMLTQTAIEVARELPQDMPTPRLSVSYVPQLGFLITVESRAASQIPANGPTANWQRMFVTEAGSYFKNDKMRQMDHDLGDLWVQICDAEIEISHNLAQKILESEAYLLEASNACGQLDAMLALSHGAIEHHLVRPRMVEANVIDIVGGRHLIQEMTVAAYVANDTFLVGGTSGQGVDEPLTEEYVTAHPNLLILTGPNYSGKSVYLKQVALIVYLAQVGCFVPAQRACLGITDKILTRVTTRETVAVDQSAFMIDVRQMAYALNACTPRSLLVIDEFGKGTDVGDGAGLVAGVLEYLLSLKSQSPKVVVSTHFHEIFEQGLISENALGLVMKQMEVLVRPSEKANRSLSHHNSDITYLYNVTPGRSKLSYGAQCAAMNGIPDAVITRACELTDLAVAGADLVAMCSQVAPDELNDLEAAEAISRAFIKLDLESVQDGDENQSEQQDSATSVLEGLLHDYIASDTCDTRLVSRSD